MTKEAATAKLFASEVGMRACTQAIQIQRGVRLPARLSDRALFLRHQVDLDR